MVSAEVLGGARMHCSVSGVADQLARDDEQALLLARAALQTAQQDMYDADLERPPRHVINPLYTVTTPMSCFFDSVGARARC